MRVKTAPGGGVQQLRPRGRDPSLLGDQMDRLLLDRGWKVDVAVGSVMGRGPQIVGTDVAAHSTPVTFADGILIVRADSTAGPPSCGLESSSILGRLEAEVGKDAVSELRVRRPGCGRAGAWAGPAPGPADPGPRAPTADRRGLAGRWATARPPARRRRTRAAGNPGA